ncbi:hypothetical protein ACOSP7_023908 [Xanthoceras sorbifolium]
MIKKEKTVKGSETNAKRGWSGCSTGAAGVAQGLEVRLEVGMELECTKVTKKRHGSLLKENRSRRGEQLQWLRGAEKERSSGSGAAPMATGSRKRGEQRQWGSERTSSGAVKVPAVAERRR